MDAAFCHGRAGWGPLDCTFLFNDELMPLCSPRYLAAASAAERDGEAPGQYTVAVRATDGTGALQISEDRGTVPEGSTGLHRVLAAVT